MFDELAGLQVHFQTWPEVVVKRPAALIIPPTKDDGVPASQETAHMVVTPDVEDHILGAVVRFLFADHPSIGLVDAITSHAKVADRFAQMTGQVLLPGFRIADLMTLRKAIAIRVDATRPVGIDHRCAGSIGLDRGNRRAVVQSVRRQVVAQDIT